jgi:molecular chaperone DnaK (HSP70)
MNEMIESLLPVVFQRNSYGWGTTRMPKIRRMVRDELFISDLNTHIDPDLTMAIGTASVID